MSEIGEKALRALEFIRPPEGYRGWMMSRGMCDAEILTLRCVSKAEAEGYSMTEGVYDARYAELPSITGGRNAIITCSSCGGKTLVRYEPGTKTATGYRGAASIEWWSPTDATSLTQSVGHRMACPQCGWDCTLRRASEVVKGIPEQSRLTTAHRAGDMLLLVDWMIERRCYEARAEWHESAIQAYAFTGKEKARLTQYTKGTWGLIFTGWEEKTRFEDRLCRVTFCKEGFPDLTGTGLENCRLREFLEQTESTEASCPVAWLRLWQKHRNAEVLIDAGLGKLLAEMIHAECCVPIYGYYYQTGERYRGPKLTRIDWKKKRPSAMLGMTAPELRRVKDEVQDGKTLSFLLEHKGEAGRMLDLLKQTQRLQELKDLLELCGKDIKPEKVVGYLKKQHRRAMYLQDYWRMAGECGMDLTQEPVRWPRDLSRAHDDANVLRLQIKAEKEAAETAEAWAAMNEKLRGLAWEKNGICIRPAHSTQELVEEGQTLHHCVGGYTNTHLKGKIILFVRRARRPERSWYTLNIDLKAKRRIQLHGYGNERNPKREILKIPREVLEFVAQWEAEVLAKWKEPKNTGGEHGERTAAA